MQRNMRNYSLMQRKFRRVTRPVEKTKYDLQLTNDEKYQRLRDVQKRYSRLKLNNPLPSLKKNTTSELTKIRLRAKANLNKSEQKIETLNNMFENNSPRIREQGSKMNLKTETFKIERKRPVKSVWQKEKKKKRERMFVMKGKQIMNESAGTDPSRQYKFRNFGRKNSHISELSKMSLDPSEQIKESKEIDEMPEIIHHSLIISPAHQSGLDRWQNLQF